MAKVLVNGYWDHGKKKEIRSYAIHGGLIPPYTMKIGSDKYIMPGWYKLDKNEEPLKCGLRELEEETGYKSNKLTFLTNIHPAIGFSNEKMWMYLAEELELSEKKLDDDEFLELLPTPLNVALEWVFSGKITDVKTIIGIMWMKELKFNH